MHKGLSMQRRSLNYARVARQPTGWFVFPRVDGLGRSSTTQHYAIRSRGEALDYGTHPLLGPRLIECTKAVLGITKKSAHDIFGSPDDVKFRFEYDAVRGGC